MKVTDINVHSSSNAANDDLRINFESRSQIHSLLYKVSLTDLLKIKYSNRNNKIINDFFASLSSR